MSVPRDTDFQVVVIKPGGKMTKIHSGGGGGGFLLPHANHFLRTINTRGKVRFSSPEVDVLLIIMQI